MHDTALLYSIGALAEPERLRFEELLAEGNEEAVRELRECQEIAARLAMLLAEGRPSPSVKERLMASVRAKGRDGFSEFEPGIHVLRQDAGRWRQLPWPGVTTKLLHADRTTGFATHLLKLEPGAKYPSHHHAGVEQCLVLEGQVRIGDLLLQAGDFEKADAGTIHHVVTTDAGCLLLIIASKDDEVFAL
jgi:quercetin dioxygenase-like cupin family protein